MFSRFFDTKRSHPSHTFDASDIRDAILRALEEHPKERNWREMPANRWVNPYSDFDYFDQYPFGAMCEEIAHLVEGRVRVGYMFSPKVTRGLKMRSDEEYAKLASKLTSRYSFEEDVAILNISPSEMYHVYVNMRWR